MRLIDADKLDEVLESFEKKYNQTFFRISAGAVKWIRTVVYAMPTIEAEPVRNGRWIWNIEKTKPFCSECLEEPYRKSNKKLPNFCPYCGANMNAGLQDLEELEMTV